MKNMHCTFFEKLEKSSPSVEHGLYLVNVPDVGKIINNRKTRNLNFVSTETKIKATLYKILKIIISKNRNWK